MPSVNWRWWLVKTSNLAKLAEITTNAHSKKLSLMLNHAGSAEFSMHLEDDKIKYVEELSTSLLCYRNNKPIWSGPIFDCVDNAENNNTCQVTARGWFELLNNRMVHTGREWQEMVLNNWFEKHPKSFRPELKTPGEIESFYNLLLELGIGLYYPVATESALQLYYGKLEEPYGVPRNRIAVDLINRANIDYPTGITIGLNPESSSLNFTVPQFHPVGELITQLTSIENSFDFAIDPVTREFNIYYNQVRPNSTIYGLGQDRGEKVRFTYPGNCISANRSVSGSKMRNRIEAVGPYGVGKGESVTSINKYDVLFENSESLTDTPNIDILIAYANAQVAVLENPFKILTFVPRAVSKSKSFSVPRPFEDYEIGDVVYAKVKKGPRFRVGEPNLQPVRVFGFNVEISDVGVEKITNLQTVYTQ